MANKKLTQANKIVTKATTVFGDAITQVEKANDILKKGIEEDTYEIMAAEQKIEELKDFIEGVKEDREDKGLQVIKNDDLVKQLKSFSPQQ